MFNGYFDNPEANRSKHRDGVYHSGDLGHVLLLQERLSRLVRESRAWVILTRRTSFAGGLRELRADLLEQIRRLVELYRASGGGL